MIREKLAREPWLRSFALGMAAYAVLTVAGAVVVNLTHPRAWIAVLVALPAIAAVVFAIVSQARGVRAREGVERASYVESTSVAFIATMLSSLAYGFLESWADAPRLSAFWVWFYGMAVWSLVAAVMNRSYR